MAKTKTEKIASIEEEIRQLENKRKQLVQAQKAQERKDRTKRLCRRMGLLENMLPTTITLTDEQFKTFLESTLITEYSRRILAELPLPEGRTYIPHDCGIVRSAEGVLCLSAQKETAGNARRKENGAWRSTIAVLKSSHAAKANLP